MSQHSNHSDLATQWPDATADEVADYEAWLTEQAIRDAAADEAFDRWLEMECEG